MEIYPPSLEKLIERFSRLPGIGKKSATRLALYILKSDKDLAESLARSLLEVKDKIKFCSNCFNLSDSEVCAICSDKDRATGVLCIVESPGDQMAIEESGSFKGRYHILHGVLSPLDGIGPEDLKIGELLSRIDKEDIKEVILATNPSTQGEATASFLVDILAGRGLKVTRIALGVPMGGDLKYMDCMTLRHSFNCRIQLSS
ncbi:MAG: recombination protein RecR [Deltaproteobacteria bacterium]|nr:recombination protein RecR [Deltaproteobacteria bacterium]